MESESRHRSALSQEIAELERLLWTMCADADEMVGNAIESLANLDPNLAQAVIEKDDDIDKLDIEIETRCLRLLALQQPMASDLREIGTIIKAITDIERVGDLAVDIAKAGRKIEQELGSSDYVDIRLIGGLARAMFRSSISAFVKRDLEIVDSVVAQDDHVDELYRSLREQIFDRMRSSPDDVVAASWLLIAIHHIERVADHAVNIAERVAFMITGQFEQLARSHMSEPNDP